jgi:hypothetical protein
MGCPVLTFTGKTPFTNQITVSTGQIQPGVPVTISATVTNTGAAGIGQVLLFWASDKRGAPWPNGVFEPTWIVPEVGSYNGQVQIVGAGPCDTVFTTLWLPDNSVVPAAGANQGVLIVFAQIVIIPVLGTCAGSSSPWSFDMGDPLNGAAMFPYFP